MSKILFLTLMTFGNIEENAKPPQEIEYFDKWGNKLETKNEEGHHWHVKRTDKSKKMTDPTNNAGKHNPYKGWNTEESDVQFGGSFSW